MHEIPIVRNRHRHHNLSGWAITVSGSFEGDQVPGLQSNGGHSSEVLNVISFGCTHTFNNGGEVEMRKASSSSRISGSIDL